VLGGIVLMTDDLDRRERALEEGERLLDGGAVSHNHLVFHLDATDSCFDHEEWDRMDHFADRLQAYARAEPLPWSEFLVARARALAAWGRGHRTPNVLAELRRLHDMASGVELIDPLSRLAVALDGGLGSGLS